MNPAEARDVPWIMYIPIIITSIGVVIAEVGAVVWAYRDARKRRRSGILVAVLVAMSFPWGLAIWLIARPNIRPRDDPFWKREDHRASYMQRKEDA